MTDSADLSWAEELFSEEPWIFRDGSVFPCTDNWDMPSSVLNEASQTYGCDALDPLLFLQQNDSNGPENGVPTPANPEVEASNRLDVEQAIHDLQQRVDALEDKLSQNMSRISYLEAAVEKFSAWASEFKAAVFRIIHGETEKLP